MQLLCLPLLVLSAHQLLASTQNFRLPRDVVPLHYQVSNVYHIDPELKFPFVGTVNIRIEANNDTNKIVLHAQDYEILNKSITIKPVHKDEDPIKVKDVEWDTKYNLFTINLEGTMVSGSQYELMIPYCGNLGMNLDGAYISTYEDKATRKKEYLIVTQFEATSARKAFPCFDEPEYKATFELNLGHHSAFTAVSNMPLARTNTVKNYTGEIAENQYWTLDAMADKLKTPLEDFAFDSFEVSVPMSTYLVAYTVSKFLFVDSDKELSPHTKFRIWARSDAISQTAYASNIGPRVLTYFEEWFNVSFPLPKQDMFAIPDFSAGAMENWGLVTYRETALLYDTEESTLLNKERIASVIAHELAHQWFGNLVTMKWWSDLWLNEGFATYMASVGVNAVEPQWEAMLVDGSDHMLAVLNLDSLKSSHPVSVFLDDPKRISEIFDEISYLKGSTLIRMMAMFLGDDVFRKAITNYLIKYSYKNAEQDDLWEQLTLVADTYNVLPENVTVKEIMDTWTTQTGYPVLTVDRDYDGHAVLVTQKRYLSSGVTPATAASWWVPLRTRCQRDVANNDTAVTVRDADKGMNALRWLPAGSGVTEEMRYEHGAAEDEWLLFNVDMLAPVRVNYDERNWQLLVDAMNGEQFDTIPVLSRVQLLSDAFAFAWNGVVDYTTALKLISYLPRETEFLPIDSALSALGKIEHVVSKLPQYGALQKFVRQLITKHYHNTGGLYTKSMKADDMNSVQMQVLLSRWACKVKVQGCEDNAMEMFDEWMQMANPDRNNPIPPPLRYLVYCTAISRGDVSRWRFLLQRLQKANVASSARTLLQAMACSRDVWIVKQFLEWTLEEGSVVRKQDSEMVLVSLLRNPVGYYVARDFIYYRIEDIAARHKGHRLIGSIVKVMLDQFTTQTEMDQFLTWREKYADYLTDAKLGIEQAIEKAKLNLKWLDTNMKFVVEKMREYAE